MSRAKARQREIITKSISGCLIGFWRGQGRGNGQLSGGSAGDAPVGEGGGGAAFKGAIALAGQLVRSGVKYRSEVAIASAVGWRS